MQLERQVYSQKLQFNSVTDTYVCINNKVYYSSIIIRNDKVESWGYTCWQQLNEIVIAELAEICCDILLLGLGETFVQLTPAVLAPLYIKAQPFEQMSSAAAARTFTLLSTEGRKVVAVLLYGRNNSSG